MVNQNLPYLLSRSDMIIAQETLFGEDGKDGKDGEDVEVDDFEKRDGDRPSQ